MKIKFNIVTCILIIIILSLNYTSYSIEVRPSLVLSGNRFHAIFKEYNVQRNNWLSVYINSSGKLHTFKFIPFKPFRPIIKYSLIKVLKSKEQVLSVTRAALDRYDLDIIWPATSWYGTTTQINNSSLRLDIFIPPTAMLGYYKLEITNGIQFPLITSKAIYVDLNDNESRE